MKSLAERFWAKVDTSAGPDGCWPWMAGTWGQYGRFRAFGRMEQAHRVAYMLAKGPIPIGMDVLHDCDNPPCCNTGHLFPGTDLDNVRDCIAKGRRIYARGERNGTHTHPESVARGERNGAHTHPERLARGDCNGARLHPERMPHGETHGTQTQPERVARGERNGSAKLTEARVREVRRLSADGDSQRKIALLMGVSQRAIAFIVHGETWRHILPIEEVGR